MMQKILLATHGHLASGLLSTLKIIAGDVSRVQAIDGYTEAEDITSAIENTLDSLRDSDQLIVFTDLFGGSVNQLVTKLVMEKNIPAIIVSGFNVALVFRVSPSASGWCCLLSSLRTTGSFWAMLFS